MKLEENKGITVRKSENFSEWYSQVIQKAELADIRYGIQGFIVHRPWGFMIIREIYRFLEKEFEEKGHLPYLFPIAVKEKDLKKEKEHAGFTPNVFWITHAGEEKLEERFALRPTGEAQIYPMYSLWFRSHKDLPFKAYQSRISAFRNEMTTRPFLRGREFLFFESHNLFNNHKEAEEQITEDFGICDKIIYQQLKIPFIYFERPQWDKFKGADNTYAPDTLMPDGRRNQLASTHDLGQNFSKAYDIKVQGSDKKAHYVWQTCFGPGIWRIMAALIGVHGDDKGLILPFDVAPLQIIIVPIYSKNKEKNEVVTKFCEKIEAQLKAKNYRLKIDNSEETPGFKFNKWELKGVPIRIEVGPRDVDINSVTVVARTKKDKEQIKISMLDEKIKILSNEIDKTIKEHADNQFKDNTREETTINKLKITLENHKGFVKVPFCTTEKKGEECADLLKEKTNGGNVCGVVFQGKEKPQQGQKCIICGKPAHHMVYIAKSY